MADTIPNLDAMDPTELWEFHNRYSRPSRLAVRQLLGLPLDSNLPRGAIGIARCLAAYAANKATAMACRIRGEVDSALQYETIADRIYDRLPETARW